MFIKKNSRFFFGFLHLFHSPQFFLPPTNILRAVASPAFTDCAAPACAARHHHPSSWSSPGCSTQGAHQNAWNAGLSTGLGWAGLGWLGWAGGGRGNQTTWQWLRAVARLAGSRHRPGGRMAINQPTSVTLHTLTLHITHLTSHNLTLEVNT